MKTFFLLCILYFNTANAEIFQTEAFTVWLPAAPKVKNQTYTATDTSSVALTVYTVIHRQNNEGTDALTLFEDLLITNASWPNVLAEYQFSEIEGNQVLDFVIQNSINGVVLRERVIVCEHAIFLLRTVASMLSANNHDYFINSFQPHCCIIQTS